MRSLLPCLFALLTVAPAFGSTGFQDVGLLAPLRYRLNERTVLATHPLLFALAPNLDVARTWLLTPGTELGSRHHIVYPTPLLRLLARPGTGGIYPADVDVAHLVLLGSELYLRQRHGPFVVEPAFGGRTALLFGPGDLPTLDLPYFYPRTAAIQHGLVATAALKAAFVPAASWALHLDHRLFAVADADTWFHLEQLAYLCWHSTPSLSLHGGWFFLRSDLAYGREHRLMPYFDLIWRW